MRSAWVFNPTLFEELDERPGTGERGAFGKRSAANRKAISLSAERRQTVCWMTVCGAVASSDADGRSARG